jgi:hypothetical protein
VLTTAIHSVLTKFASVDNYAVYDKGKLHLGATIRNFLDQHHIRYTGFAKEIGMSRGGVHKIFEQSSINTERLQQISRVLKHDFFKYLIDASTVNELGSVKEPEPEYPKKKTQKRVIVINFDDDDPENDADLFKRLSKYIQDLDSSDME